MKLKKAFSTDKFKLTSKQTKAGVRYFAIATAPSGASAYRIVGKEFYKNNK